MTRKKKGVEIKDIKIQVCIYAFDLMYLNGESLLKKSFGERRNLMRTSFPSIPQKFVYAQGVDCSEANDIQEELDLSIKGGCEGLMVKTLWKDATYEIDTRSHKWLKVKKDYMDGVGDSLDLVVIGAWPGKGKRASTYGAYGALENGKKRKNMRIIACLAYYCVFLRISTTFGAQCIVYGALRRITALFGALWPITLVQTHSIY